MLTRGDDPPEPPAALRAPLRYPPIQPALAGPEARSGFCPSAASSRTGAGGSSTEATDAAVARPDIDGSRTAMMGGSYGGYMANWVAGHTDRFRAIVSHASLWVLDQMFGTTDLPMSWRPQFGDPLASPERYEANSPHRHVASIRTPMLVIHGNKDYRVPVGEALRLWWDLSRHGA